MCLHHRVRGMGRDITRLKSGKTGGPGSGDSLSLTTAVSPWTSCSSAHVKFLVVTRAPECHRMILKEFCKNSVWIPSLPVPLALHTFRHPWAMGSTCKISSVYRTAVVTLESQCLFPSCLDALAWEWGTTVREFVPKNKRQVRHEEQ